MADSLHGGWVRVVLDVPDHATELATALMVAEGASGIEVQDAETFEAGALPPGQARVITFVGGESPEAVRLRLEAAISRAEIFGVTLSVEEFTDESWKHKWKAFFEPSQVSARLAVAPPWNIPDQPVGVETLVIEPGLAFGTGTHATTILCLAWLDELLDGEEAGPRAMLDVGCGSGILSIAAAKLRSDMAIDALDTDPEAHRVARDNFAANGVSGRVRLVEPPVLAEVGGGYPLVVANILAHILNFLSEDLVRLTESGGMLLLSGIGDDSVEGVLATFGALGMEVRETRKREGWNALVLEHRPPEG